MAEPWTTALLAISYDVLPELQEQRGRYYLYWNFVGAAAIIGWLVVLVLYRLRTPRQPALTAMVAVAVAAGGGFGWAVWSRLSGYSWGDVAVGSRWLGELAVCILGCVGWLLVTAWLLLCRR